MVCETNFLIGFAPIKKMLAGISARGEDVFFAMKAAEKMTPITFNKNHPCHMGL